MARSTVSARRSQLNGQVKSVMVSITIEPEAAVLLKALAGVYEMRIADLVRRQLTDAIAADVDCVWGRVVHARPNWLTVKVA